MNTTETPHFMRVTPEARDSYFAFLGLVNQAVYRLLNQAHLYPPASEPTRIIQVRTSRETSAEGILKDVDGREGWIIAFAGTILQMTLKIEQVINTAPQVEAEAAVVSLYRALVNVSLGSASVKDTEVLGFIREVTANTSNASDMTLDELLGALYAPQITEIIAHREIKRHGDFI